jgi:hypothetical protein
VGYFRPASWDTAWAFATDFDGDIWLIWPPVEAFGVALLIGGAIVARRRGRLGQEGVDGLLLAVGLVVCSAMVAFAGSPLEVRATGTAIFTALGAVSIAMSGALGILTRRGREAGLPRRIVGISAAGVLLALAPLVVNFGNWNSALLIDGIAHDYGLPNYIEVLVAGTLAIFTVLALAGAPRARLHTGGALVGIGTVLLLHLIGIAVHISYFTSVGDLRWGGALGIAGGLLLVAAGAMVLQADRPAETPAAVGMPVT